VRMVLALMIIAACAALPGVGLAQDQPPAPAAPVMRETASLSGRVTDLADQPLAGVAVKVFEEGILVAEVQTEADGTYLMRFPYLPDIDWTVVAWYVPAVPELVPEILVLRESLRSKSVDLWSTCLPRVDLRGEMHYDAKLVDGKTKQEMISQLECFKRQTQ